jgi:hypothetical protein
METILLVCADAEQSADILRRLDREGANPIGPAATAGLALLLAAQSAPRSAILVGETTGRRDAGSLARELAATWGVDVYVLPATDASTPGELADEAEERRAPLLRDILGAPALRPAAIH